MATAALTSNGKTRRIQLLGSLMREPELQEVTVTPTAESQEITPPDGCDGFSKVLVEACDDLEDAEEMYF